MSQREILRTTVFGGFKKVDVINYIEELQTQNVKLEEKLAVCDELNSEIASLNLKINALNEEKTALEEKAASYMRKLCEYNASFDAIEEKLDALTASDSEKGNEECEELPETEDKEETTESEDDFVRLAGRLKALSDDIGRFISEYDKD